MQEKSEIFNVNILKSTLSAPRFALRLDPHTGSKNRYRIIAYTPIHRPRIPRIATN